MEKQRILDIEQGFQSFVIAVGFDGTCVKNAFPKIGEGIGAENVLRKLTDTGHRIILSTIRTDQKNVLPGSNVVNHGNLYFTEALCWFEANNIPLFGVNRNPCQKSWSKSGKIDADLYIDYKALGIPLINPIGEQSYLDWRTVEIWLERNCWFWN